MQDPSDPLFAAWPEALAQLDEEQYDALSATLAALKFGAVQAAELDRMVTGASVLAIGRELVQMQSIAADRRRRSRAELVEKVSRSWRTRLSAKDLAMLVRPLGEETGLT